MNKFISFHLLFIFFLCFSVTTTNSLTLPRLSPFSESKTTKYQNTKTFNLNKDMQLYFYEQTLDHFNYLSDSYKTFKQRYIINYNYWGGANSSAPIFAYLGGEDDIVNTLGFMMDNATSFKALLVYIEHRYYGKSVPSFNASYGYLNSAQALADYAEVLLYLKDSLHAQKSPVIVVGGSYAGMLAAWFRLKYPHIAIGALASSAPLLYFDNITPASGYNDVITRDFQETSKTCYETIRNSWFEIDEVASKPNGLNFLSKKFNTCYPLEQPGELKDYLGNMYQKAAQYNGPPVTTICEAIDRATYGDDILSRIYGGMVASYGNKKCNVNPDKYTGAKPFDRWRWQTCTEIVMPIGIGDSSLFQPKPFNFTSFAENCKKDFGVQPRPHWITSYYGGQDIQLVLKRFGSNIIFSNGLRDPYSSGGVLNNISDSLVALPTVNGTHCQDLVPAIESDPAWLVHQRNTEVEIIQSWIKKYYDEVNI